MLVIKRLFLSVVKTLAKNGILPSDWFVPDCLPLHYVSGNINHTRPLSLIRAADSREVIEFSGLFFTFSEILVRDSVIFQQ